MNLYRTKAHASVIRKMHTRGLILFESLPSLFIASRMQARSTTAGTPVKSCAEKKSSKEQHITEYHPSLHSYFTVSRFQMLARYLQENTGGLEWNLNLLCRIVFPVKDLLNIFFFYLKIVTITNGRFKENPDGVWQPVCYTGIKLIP